MELDFFWRLFTWMIILLSFAFAGWLIGNWIARDKGAIVGSFLGFIAGSKIMADAWGIPFHVWMLIVFILLVYLIFEVRKSALVSFWRKHSEFMRKRNQFSKFAKLYNLYKNPFAWILIFYVLWLNLYFRVASCFESISIIKYGYIHPSYKLVDSGDIFMVCFGFFFIIINLIGWEVSHRPEWRAIRGVLGVIAILLLIILILFIYSEINILEICSRLYGRVEKQ